VLVSDGDGQLALNFAGHELPHRIGCVLKWVGTAMLGVNAPASMNSASRSRPS